MATDLHDRLRTTVEARLAQARAYLDTDHAAAVPMSVWEDGFTAIRTRLVARHCEADLKRLERHRPYWFDLGGRHCTTCGFLADPELAWPCPEIDLLAAVYEVGP